MVAVSLCLQISSALLRVGLIERRDGMFGLEKPAMGPIILLTIALNVAAQLGDLVESLIKRGASVQRLGSDSSRPRWHARPHRRPALCRSCIMVLYGLARDAVVPLPANDRPEARKIRSQCRLCTNSSLDHETHRHPGIDRLDWPQHAQRRRVLS